MYVRVVFYHRHVISGDTTHRKGERERERGRPGSGRKVGRECSRYGLMNFSLIG